MDAFIGYLRQILGRFVQVERGGPEACQGWLYAVQSDYLTLRSECGSDLHLPLHHVRSVTPLPLPPLHPTEAAETDALPEYFRNLLQRHVGDQVRLYHAGPEVTVGTLRECGQDFLLLEISPDEVAGFTLFHVRSLYVGPETAEFTSPEPSYPLQGG